MVSGIALCARYGRVVWDGVGDGSDGRVMYEDATTMQEGEEKHKMTPEDVSRIFLKNVPEEKSSIVS